MNGQEIKFKQFYLWDVMQFVIPFLKQRQTLRGSGAPYFYLRNEDDPNHVKGENQAHENDDEGEDEDDTSRETSQTPSLPLAESTPASATAKRPRKRFWTPDSFERPQPPAESPDLQFFRSIVPDMAAFNPSQKRRFKLRVLQLLEEMSAENPPVLAQLPPEIPPTRTLLTNEAVAVAIRPVITNEAVRPVMTNEVPSIRPVMSNGGPAPRPVTTNSSYSTASTEYTIYQQAPGSQPTIYR